MNKAKAQLTMAAAVVVFLGGTAYGAALLTKKADAIPDGPTCEARTIKSGEDVTTNLVTVNVYNASQRSGLANRVNINLQRNGFLGGRIGNAGDVVDKDIATDKVSIVTSDKNDPQVQLVAKQFKDRVTFAAPKGDTGKGVTIVVGDNYSGLANKPPRSVKSDRTLDFCVPFVTVN